MDLKTFERCSSLLPADKSVLVRADHGVGKSETVYNIGLALRDRLELEGVTDIPSKERARDFVVERRLSQMTEGDMIGLPVMSSLESGEPTTTFAPPDWYMECCRHPRVLFLDEINRACPEIMQAAFQIVLDRTLNGHKLHPQTRVFAAVNNALHYNVNDMDPALLDRFWVVDLTPSQEEWLEHAKTRAVAAVYSFVRQNLNHLEHTSSYEPGKVYPSRRSWIRLSDALRHTKLDDPSDGEQFALVYSLATGFVGNEAAISFRDHVQAQAEKRKQLTADDVLDRWNELKSILGTLGNERYNILIEKIGEDSLKRDWTDAQVKNLSLFTYTLPRELVIPMWVGMANHHDADGKSIANVKNLQRWVDQCGPLVKMCVSEQVGADIIDEEDKKIYDSMMAEIQQGDAETPPAPKATKSRKSKK